MISSKNLNQNMLKNALFIKIVKNCSSSGESAPISPLASSGWLLCLSDHGP